MPVYAIPSSPTLPESFGTVDHSVSEDASIAGLAKRVSAYLARVVGALADFEDRLLTEDGFFAREEHFESQIDSLRREFESNKRAAVSVVPASPNSVSLRRLFLCACFMLSAHVRASLLVRRVSSSAPTRSGC